MILIIPSPFIFRIFFAHLLQINPLTGGILLVMGCIHQHLTVLRNTDIKYNEKAWKYQFSDDYVRVLELKWNCVVLGSVNPEF